MTLVINGKDYLIPNSDWVGSPGLVQKKQSIGFGPQTLVQLTEDKVNTVDSTP